MRKKLLDEYWERRKRKSSVALKIMKLREGVYLVILPRRVTVPAVGYYGAENSAICKCTLDLVRAAGEEIKTTPFNSPLELKAAFERPAEVRFTASATT